MTLSTGKMRIFLPVNLCLHRCGGLKESGSEGATNANPSLTRNTYAEVPMALISDSGRDAPAQPFTDPLIVAARFLNEAADLERRLAIRKALRPARSQAARKGWEARRV